MGPSRRPGTCVPVGLLVLAGLLVGCGASPGEDASLHEQGFEPTRVTKLPGGDRIATGSPDGHAVVVQWQSKGSDGWTAPATIFTDAKQFTHGITVVAAGDTVAIDPDFWVERELDDDYDPDHAVQVLCHDRVCDEGRTSPFLTGTELDAAGDFASFGLGDGRVLLWSDGTYREATFTGVPEGDYPEMFPDGSFGVIAAEQHGRLCRYRLLTSEPRRTALSLRAVSGDRPASPPCDTSSTDLAADRATVSVESLQDSVDFARKDGTWSVDEATSPLAAYPDTEGQSSLKNDLALRVDGSTVSIGSPDLKRIFTQYRAPDSQEWTPPQLVATAPRGTLCRFQTHDRDELATTAVISCFDASRSFELGTTRPTRGIALATTDGRSWEARTLVRPNADVVRGGGHDKIFQGTTHSYLWSPTTRMRRIDLPTDPTRDGLVSTPDGKLIRTLGNVDGGPSCKPGYQVTPIGSTSWPAARLLPGFAKDAASDTGCSAFLFPLDGVFDIEVGSQSWTGSIVHRGDDWVAEQAPESY